jgi:hypothetical protein
MPEWLCAITSGSGGNGNGSSGLFRRRNTGGKSRSAAISVVPDVHGDQAGGGGASSAVLLFAQIERTFHDWKASSVTVNVPTASSLLDGVAATRLESPSRQADSGIGTARVAFNESRNDEGDRTAR